MVASDNKIAACEVYIATDNDYANPDGKLAANHKPQYAGEKQGPIDDGVHHLAKPADCSGHTGNLAIEPIG